MSHIALLERLRRHRLLRRYRRWQGGHKLLRQVDLFIFPNRYGFYMGFLVLVGFAMGYKVQNNFVLIGTIFLFLLFMLSLISSAQNLQGFEVIFLPAAYYFADTSCLLRIQLKRNRPGYHIEIMPPAKKSRPVIADLSGGNGFCRVDIGYFSRGLHPMPKIKLRTHFPFGIVRCWTWLQPPLDIIVCPQPVEHSLSHYETASRQASHLQLYADNHNHHRQQGDSEELRDPRPFEEGDLPSRIDWKRVAATQETFVRDYSRPHKGDIFLQAPADLSREAALSYLCGGLLVCERAGRAATMLLDGRYYAVQNAGQRQEALHALAVA